MIKDIYRIYKEGLKFNSKKNKHQIINSAKDLNRHFTKENVQIANKHMKRCSTLYVIRETQIKMSIKYHYTHRITKFQKSNTSKC